MSSSYEVGMIPHDPKNLGIFLQEELQRIAAAMLRPEQLQNFANDAAAATGGIKVGELYRNASVVMVRVA